MARQLAADAQHGAVAAHHHAQLAPVADGGQVQRWKLRQPGGVGRSLFQTHLAALLLQELADLGHQLARGRASTGFHQNDGEVGVFAQAGSHHGASRATAHHNEIEGLGHG